jgi:hypothetical protein
LRERRGIKRGSAQHSIILVALFAVFCALAYLPAHVSTMVKRAQWYISGVDLLEQLLTVKDRFPLFHFCANAGE